MIEGLQPYSEYKDSEQRWLGRLPSAWKVLPLCRVAAVKSECGRPDLELLSVYLTRGVIRYSDSGGQVHKPSLDLSKYQVVDPGDFVLNNQQAWRGSIGVSRYRGIISPAYVIMKLSSRLQPEYANLMFRSPAMVAQWVVASRGVGDIQRNLYYPDLRGSLVPVPPPGEQSAIVRFLDHANRKIDGFIRAKRKLIGLLNEQKQAIIHRAVTRGLHPDVPLMSSGIPWLGDIPKHWEVLRARFLFRPVTRRDVQKDDPKMSVTQRRGLVPTDEMEENSTQARSFDRFQVCHPQDLVLNKYKAHLGVFCCAFQRGLITPNYTVFRPSRKLHTYFFDVLFHTATYRNEFSMMVHGVTEGMSPLYTQDFNRVPVIFPPYEEQKAIVEGIEALTKPQNTAIARTEREIALMQEYRTRLTADLVTGKLDVREAAAQLPAPPVDPAAEPVPDEPLEEIEVESTT